VFCYTRPMERNEPRTPRQERSIATKDQLFKAALELFAEEGYHRTTSKKIAARAGMAVGSFYAYYRNKKAVFLEAIEYYYGQIAEDALGELPGLAESPDQDPREYLAAIIGKLYDAHDISPQLHREITGMRYSDPDVDRLISAEERKTVLRVQKILESMRPAPAIEDTEAAAYVVHRSAEELIHSIKIFGPPIDPQRLLSELKRMLGRYLFGS
jgi:AcrR family transcriptional regulator